MVQNCEFPTRGKSFGVFSRRPLAHVVGFTKMARAPHAWRVRSTFRSTASGLGGNTICDLNDMNLCWLVCLLWFVGRSDRQERIERAWRGCGVSRSCHYPGDALGDSVKAVYHSAHLPPSEESGPPDENGSQSLTKISGLS